MNDTLGGQGATLERKRQSSIQTKPRLLTKGGMTATYGDMDKEHCLLDWMLNQGVIEKDQYDAGYQLRRIYFTFNKSGTSCLTEKDNAYEGDFETEADRAEIAFKDAMRALDHNDKGLIRFVCIEATSDQTAGIYACAMMIQNGLEDLKKHFVGRNK